MQEAFEKIKEFCLTYKKYIGACALFIAFVAVLAFSTSTDSEPGDDVLEVGDSETEEISDTEMTEKEETFVFQEEFDVDRDEEMKNLFAAYFKAYTKNDIASLEKIAFPLSENEKSYIAVVSKYYDKIDKFTCYSKPAPQKDAYFVSVENEITFDGIKTKAPALDFFYVERDESGKLYINNAYSVFNLNFMDNEVSSEIYSLVQQYMQQPDFVKLQQKVQSEYDEALAKDSDLAGVIQKTLDSAIKKWSSELQSSALKEETTETTEQTEDTKKEDKKDSKEETKEEDKKDSKEETKEEDKKGSKEETKEEDKKGSKEETKEEDKKDSKEETKEEDKKDESKKEQKEEQPQKTTVRAKDVVNVRKAASADSDQLGQFLPGAELKKLGEEGEWTIIEFQGGKGYVKTEFLE